MSRQKTSGIRGKDLTCSGQTLALKSMLNHEPHRLTLRGSHSFDLAYPIGLLWGNKTCCLYQAEVTGENEAEGGIEQVSSAQW